MKASPIHPNARSVLIDATSICESMKGVGRYAWQMYRALHETAPVDSQLIVATHESSLNLFSEDANVRLVGLPAASELSLGWRIFPRLLKQFAADTFIRPADKIGRRYHARTLTVCHDLNQWIWDQCPQRPLKRRCIDRLWERLRISAMRHSDLVVCNSKFVQQGVIDQFGIAPEKTAIGYCGVDERFSRLAAEVTRKELPGMPAEQAFLLAFATGDPREGYKILPEVFAAAKRNGYLGKLAIAGTKDDQCKHHLQSEFRTYGVENDVIWIPFLGSDQFRQLVALYKYADFYLETSRHEGFGMQLIEAMACGTVCFSSGRGALTEVGGGHPLVLDIDHPEFAGQQIAEQWILGTHHKDRSVQTEFALKFNWQDTRQLVSDFAWRTTG